MMTKKSVKSFLEALFYPVPKETASLEEWKAFAEKASYRRVAKVANEKYVEWQPYCRGDKRHILEILLSRVVQTPWPKISKSFYKKNAQRIFVVSSKETAKREVYNNFYGNIPKILMDLKSNCLGIVVSRNLVISGITMKVYNGDNANRMRCHNMIDNYDVNTMRKREDYINELYQLLYPKCDLYNTHYWVNTEGNLSLWSYAGKVMSFIPKDQSLARFMVKI